MKKVNSLKTILLIICFLLVSVFFVQTASAATTYRIRYYKGDGSGTYKDDNPTSGASYTFKSASTYSRTGYTLAKWNTSLDGTGTNYACGKKITVSKKITVYAQWTAKKYTVSFNSAGGSAVAAKSVTYASTYGTLTSPTRTGYTFAGWYTAASGGTHIVSTSKVGITANTTLYAHWTAKVYTLSFDSHGGTAVASKSVTYAATYGTLTSPTRTGYTFAGWYTGATTGSLVTSTTKVGITANYTFHARWTPKIYSVSFYPQGGTNVADIKITYASKYGTLPVVTREGYTFAGWFSDANVGTEITKDTVVSTVENQKLYAHWIENTYKISYCANYPSGLEGEEKITEGPFFFSNTYSIGSNNKFTYEGYYIKEWNTSRDGKGIAYQPSSAINGIASKTYNDQDLYLYAIWVKKFYTIKYDLNGGEGEMNDLSDEYLSGTFGNDISIANCDATRKGYTFDGWYVTTDGNNKMVIYPPYHKLIWDFVRNSNENNELTLYANWVPNIVKFELISQKTTDTKLDEIEVNYGDKIQGLPTPIYKNYIFLYWEDDNGKKVTNEDINMYDAEYVELKAVLQKKKYAVKVYEESGKTLLLQKMIEVTGDFTDDITKYEKRAGYNFLYWYTIVSGKEARFTIPYRITGEVNVFGKWLVVNKPKKLSKLKIKKKNKKIQITINKQDVKGYVITIKRGNKTYKKKFLAKNFNKSGKNISITLKKFPGSGKKINFTKKLNVSIAPYNVDSTNASIVANPKKKTVSANKKKSKKK